MEAMGTIVIIMAGALVLFVALVLGLGAWFMLRAISALKPIQEMLEKHTQLIDKLVTVVVAKGPLEYSSMRAADSLVSYDDDSTSMPVNKEQYDVADPAYGAEDDESFGDPVIDGTFN